MSVQTRSQRLARAAHARVSRRAPFDKDDKEYSGFARRFPALVHTCGLAQAVAFAMAKETPHHLDYLKDLAAVLGANGHRNASEPEQLARSTRDMSLAGYLRLSRDALEAATWLKRYVEAYSPDPDDAGTREGDADA